MQDGSENVHGQGKTSGYFVTTPGVMSTFAIICFGGAFLLAIAAVRHQCADFIPHHGNSMGGEIFDLFLWTMASLLVAAGSFAYIDWYFSALVFVGAFVLSFFIRYCVDSWERHRDEKRVR